jgi:uncharacterized protein
VGRLYFRQQNILIIIAIGVVAGLLSGLVGIGGGIVMVPALVYFLLMPQKAAQGASLALLMLPVGILGVMQYYKQGFVDYKIVLLLAVGFVVGSFFGSKISLSMHDDRLKKVFACIMIIVAIKMLFFDKTKKDPDAPTEKHISI